MKTTDQNAEVAVMVARFQTPFLHEGHKEILDMVTKNHPRVIVCLGLSPLKCTFKNPYDFAIRKQMVEESYPNVEVLYIDDVGDNDVWSKNLDKLIAKNVGPNLKVVLYGSRDSFIPAYSGKYPTIELMPNKIISASEIRRQAGIKSLRSLDFRVGIAYAVENQYASFKPTVDMAIINFATNELLLAQKPNEDLLRFPGGFMDPSKDKSAEEAAIRESKEETSLDVVVNAYIGSTLIDDSRYRGEQDKIMTFFYLMGYNGEMPVASDDIKFVCWKKLNEIKDEDIIKIHRPLFQMLRNFLKF